jgi:hypothetical protein
VALYWNIKARLQRPRAAFILSCAAVLIGYWGLSRVHLNASKSINGQLVWSFNSRWLFVGALVLGAASLAWSLWNLKKAYSGSAAASVRAAHTCAGDEPAAPLDGGPTPRLVDSEIGGAPPSVSDC